MLCSSLFTWHGVVLSQFYTRLQYYIALLCFGKSLNVTAFSVALSSFTCSFDWQDIIFSCQYSTLQSGDCSGSAVLYIELCCPLKLKDNASALFFIPLLPLMPMAYINPPVFQPQSEVTALRSPGSHRLPLVSKAVSEQLTEETHGCLDQYN